MKKRQMRADAIERFGKIFPPHRLKQNIGGFIKLDCQNDRRAQGQSTQMALRIFPPSTSA